MLACVGNILDSDSLDSDSDLEACDSDSEGCDSDSEAEGCDSDLDRVDSVTVLRSRRDMHGFVIHVNIVECLLFQVFQ